MGSPVTFPITLNRQDGSEILNGDLTATDGLPASGTLAALCVVQWGAITGPWASLDLGQPSAFAALDPVAQRGGLAVVQSLPSATYAIGAAIFGIEALSVSALPESSDGFDITFTAAITNADGTEAASLSGSVTIPSGTSSGSLTTAELTLNEIAGVDLTYDSGTGRVSTTAGGVYSAVLSVLFGYD